MRHNPADMDRTFLRPAVVVFIASFCTLVIEIVAGRIMAPYVGVSLYTWTSIIGVVLAGISAGAWVGGMVADRRPQSSTLGFLLLLSGLASVAIGPLTEVLAASDGLLTTMGIGNTLVSRVIWLAFLLFFVPSFLLGMISPVAVKLAVSNLASTGRVVGALYAISTAGSIAGTFATGFYLIASFGTRATLYGVAACLVATALLAGGLLEKRQRIVAAILLAVAGAWLAVQPRDMPPPVQRLRLGPETGTIHTEESQYYTIEVAATPRSDNGEPILALNLDHLTHSYSDPTDPDHFEYGYLKIFREVIRWKQSTIPDFSALFLGGGGYTLPRFIEREWLGASVDVVEIDPAVTRTAYRFLGLGPGTRVRSFNEDARWHLMRSNQRYDAVVIDVFNDLSVPYHLTTSQLTRELERILAMNGVVMANVIDNYARGRFLPSYIRTLQSVFGEDQVALILESRDDAGDASSTYVVVASPALGLLLDFIQRNPKFEGYVLPHATLQKYLAEGSGIILTDDYVPVDNMLAARFAERFVEVAE